MRLRLALLIVAAWAMPCAATPSAESTRSLDDFRDASQWTVATSDQVTAQLRATRTADRSALCLDYDFHGVSGYAAMRRPLHIDYPRNYEFDVNVRGSGPDSALQFKLADAKNENVWWVNRANFSFPHDWTLQRYKKRQIDFAWGPTADRALRSSESIEFTIYAVNGGRGEACFDDLAFHELPLPQAPPNPVAEASSSLRDAPASFATDGDEKTFWRSDPQHDDEPTLTLDLGIEREFGGLVIRWKEGAFASRYDVEFSDDRKHWRTVRRVIAGNGGTDPLYLPESEAHYVRIAMHGDKGPYAIGEVEIKDLAYGASANAFFSELAKTSPRGFYPRGFYDEQTYWTVVGIDGGHETGLFSEDGALEVSRGGFSIAPFLIDDDGRITSWADAEISHALDDGYLPIPSVVWQTRDMRLTTTAFADGKRGDSTMLAQYVLENRSDAPKTLTLALVFQPFQVNPAVQFLNTPGGVSPIHDLAFDGDRVSVDGTPRVFELAPADVAFASPFDAGLAVEHLAERARARVTASAIASAIHDDTGLASGAMLYRVSLAPHGSATFGLAIPLDGAPRPPSNDRDVATWLDARRDETARYWRDALDRVVVRVPQSAQPIADTLRTALADILISRDGPALRPGTRAYARSWIRDGAMMSAALLRLGHADAARDYLDWYSPYQFANGKVPCCVDARGSDPVPENDSHGELIYLAAEVYRYTRDRATLASVWPHVDKAERYMDQLRASERVDANTSADRRAFYGLMPASISHEGYSAKPMHSYWDDFWSLTGYDSALEIANALGKRDDASRIAQSRDEFRGDLLASIKLAVANHGIDYIPGCAELGDFDATSTTIALSPAGAQASLPQDLLHNTFERYWTQFAQRRDGIVPWQDYTPYEWRTVSSFVRLGWRDRAQQAIDFFMHDRRPAEWNQWAEVVGRDPRKMRFVGDMPHGWVASDFIRSILDLFAYERASDHALVIAAGIPDTWIDAKGVAIDHLRTSYGSLGYSLKRDGAAIVLDAHGENLSMPPGGILFAPPASEAGASVRIDGRRVEWNGSEISLRELPAHVVLSRERTQRR